MINCELELIFGRENVLRERDVLQKMSRDCCPANLLERKRNLLTASVVVKPTGTEYAKQIQKLVMLALERNLAIVARGGGSCVTGAANVKNGEIVVDMSSLNNAEIVKMPTKEKAGLVRLQAGAMGDNIDAALRTIGKKLSCGHEPASYKHYASFGGSVQCDGSGQYSCRYGKIRNIVRSVEGINGLGECVSLAGDSLKDVIGLEGGTVIITDGTMPIFAIPAYDGYLSFSFEEAGDIADFLRDLYGMRECLEEKGVAIYAVRAYDWFDYEFIAKPHKGESDKPGWYKQIEYAAEKIICRGAKYAKRLDGVGISERRGWMPWTGLIYLASDSEMKLVEAGRMIESEILSQKEERGKGKILNPAIAQMWHKNRFKLGYDKLTARFKAGLMVDTFDCAPSWETLVATYENVRSALFDFGLVGAHIGMDGSRPYIYFTFACPGRSENLYREVWEAAISSCVKSGARTTHHHGIGELKGKSNSWGAQYARGQEWLLGAIKTKEALDPHNILNPNNFLKYAKP